MHMMILLYLNFISIVFVFLYLFIVDVNQRIISRLPHATGGIARLLPLLLPPIYIKRLLINLYTQRYLLLIYTYKETPY